MRTSLLIAALAAVPSIALAAALAPSAIVANPSAYDGKSVTVSGTVKNVQTSHTPIGTVTGFQLCDKACIVVIDKTNGSHTAGSTATVTGTFHTTFKGPRKSFSNAVVIG